MAGKGRASVNDMKRVEVLVLMEIDQQTEDNGGPYGFSRKTLAERVGVSPYRARAAIDRLDSEGMIDVVSRYSDDGGQLAMVFASPNVASGILRASGPACSFRKCSRTRLLIDSSM